MQLNSEFTSYDLRLSTKHMFFFGLDVYFISVCVYVCVYTGIFFPVGYNWYI
jgi:hypothetical protein